MAERPRSHQLEDLSRQAFRASIPIAWTVSDLKDYGLDGLVEIFTPGGDRTGLQFFVQFKATGKSLRRAPLSIRFSRKTAEYYRSLALPVLVCRYHDTSGELFVRWFHEQRLPPPSQKTVSFRLSLADLWTDHHPQRIEDELRLFRSLRSPGIKLPISLSLTASPPLQFDPGLASAIRTASLRVPTVVHISSSTPAHARPEIALLADDIRINLAGITSFSLRRPVISDVPVTLVPDLYVALAMLFGHLGHYAPAAVLVSEFIHQSSLQENEAILWKSMLCLYQARRIHEAIALAETYIQHDPLKSAVFILPAMADDPPLAEAERKALENFLRRRLREAEMSGNRLALGAALYSLAKYFQSRSRYAGALRLFERCAIADPRYLRRSYYWEDYGGTCFLAGRLEQATVCYSRALRLPKVSDNCRAKLADALLFAGRYRRAETTFNQYFRDTRNVDSEWVLKSFLLLRIRQVLKLENQFRHSRKAVRLSGVESHEGPQPERMLRSLCADALWGGAWFNLAIDAGRGGDLDAAFMGFLSAAICNPRDVEACCQATLLCFSDRSRLDLLPHLVSVAYGALGEAYPSALSHTFRTQPPDFPVQKALLTIRRVIDMMPPAKRSPVTIRIFPKRGVPLELTL